MLLVLLYPASPAAGAEPGVFLLLSISEEPPLLSEPLVKTHSNIKLNWLGKILACVYPSDAGRTVRNRNVSLLIISLLR